MYFREIGGLFYRIIPKERKEFALSPAVSPEGRFHHDGQDALYMSPRPDWAEHAIDIYVRDGDPPRIICELKIESANVLDLRDAGQCAAWQVDPAIGAVPWLPEREQGLPASTWQLSDLARNNGADGLIYQSRRAPARWHLVLFEWNIAGAQARLTGQVLPYHAASGVMTEA